MSDLNTSTLRPGLLVSLKTTIDGNAKYSKRSLRDEITESGTSVLEWQTTRTIFDPEEHKRAVKARQTARNRVADVCINTGFGLLCPADQRDRLNEAVEEARVVVREFNRSAKVSRIRVYVMAGYIADSDEEALRSIASEVRDLMATMEQGIENVNATTIRDAAARALKVGQMLSPEASEQVQEAVKLARGVARKIVKAGETAAQEVDHLTIKAIAAKRTAFLDMTEVDDVIDIKGTGSALDLAAEVIEPGTRAPKQRKRQAVDLAEPEEQAPKQRRGKRERLPSAPAAA